MVRYYTDNPWWDMSASTGRANVDDDAFLLSGELRDMAQEIIVNPKQYGAAKFLGHSCLVVVREAHPHEGDRSIATLQDVLGVAVGPGASMYIERHPTWNEFVNRNVDAFTRNRDDCSQHVREPIGIVKELYLDDRDDGREERERQSVLGSIGPYVSMRLTLKEITEALGHPDDADTTRRFFTGPEAVQKATQLMAVGHEFAHPALQAFQSEYMATPQDRATH